jgi:FkbM family methyltransferase
MHSLRPYRCEFKRVSFDLSHAGKESFLLDLDLRHFSHNVIFKENQTRGFHEIETTILMAALVKEGDAVIDVGAHIGYFSLLASRLAGDTGSVFSFEPIAENLSHLHHNISINSARNIHVIPKVVGDRVCETPFHFNPDNDGGHALWNVGRHPFNTKSQEKPTVRNLPMTTIDNLFGSVDLNRLKMIKIDTEGNEFNVLMGAADLLNHHRIRCIAWEVNRFGMQQMGHSEAKLRDFMHAFGYETLAFLDGRLSVLNPGQFIRSEVILNQFFMPKEVVWASN